MSTDESRRALLEQALQALDTMQARLDAAERYRKDPIAIVGMSCRFPGSENLDAYWDLLRGGVNGVREVPKDRWDIDAYYDADPQAPGKTSSRFGGFIEGIDRFDPALFGISPREALSIDPQQRLVLEVAWEALETAGCAPDRLAGSATGVFVGITASDYGQVLRHSTSAPSDIYMATGNALNAAAGRLAFTLGLQGPCMAVDTACSSSLVAIHLACQSLRTGESDMAIAGGVNAVLLPDLFVLFTKWGMMAPDGKCKTFDAAADGFVRGEGCGMIVLKRLSDALADRDNVLAVVRGTAVNQDGRSSGLTVPNGVAQQALMRRALATAGVAPGEVDYIEAHGTGTSLGDPIEAEALGEVFGEDRPDDRPLLIGSVKTNLGHLESASGVAGVIKLVLALQNEAIPPHLHFATPSARIPWDRLPLRVPTTLTPWTRGTRERIGGVSSFGFSGTNAHLVIAEAPAPAREQSPDRPLHLFTVSAKTPDALREYAGRYAGAIADDASIGDVCFTANAGRARFAYRAAIVAGSVAQLRERLQGLAGGSEVAGVRSNHVTPGPRTKIAWLFTGQGAQYAGMGRRLYETQPAFRRTLDRCDEILRPLLDRGLLSVLYGSAADAALLDNTAYTQPALFAVEYAMAELWRSWGIEPDALLGHSVGEYVAACVAGVFSLEDGLKLIAARGRLMAQLPAGGAMASLMADIETVRAAIAGHPSVSIAAHNGPSSVVISGPEPDVAAIMSACAARNLTATRLTVSHAFHSALLDPMLDAFERTAASLSFAEPAIQLVSNRTGRFVNPGEITSAAYWRRQTRDAVRFAEGMRTLEADGCRVFIEVGPHPTLMSMGRQAVAGESASVWLASMRKGLDDWQPLLDSVGDLFVRGIEIDWAAFDAEYARRRVRLATYPFQRERYWAEGVNVAAPKTDVPAAPGDVGTWLHHIVWERRDGAPPSSTSDAGAWLIFADADGVSDHVAATAAARGIRAVTVEPAAAFARVSTNAFRVRPGDAADVERLWAEIVADGPVSRVLHLWNLRAAANERLDAGSLDEARALGVASVLDVLRALASQKSSSAKVWVVTRSAEPASGSETLALAQAPAWGLARTVALEQPERWGGIVDLDPDASARANADALCDQVVRADDEEQAAFRGGVRYVPRLVRAEERRGRATPAVSASATYLVTGGIGSLGLRIACWLADSGARHLRLTARRALPPREAWATVDDTHPSFAAVSQLRALQARGIDVRVDSVDVSDRAKMRALFEDITRTQPPLAGIVHAAGVMSLVPVESLDARALRETGAAKMEAALLLDELTRGLPLDFFVMFSSASAIWGSRGLAHYGAANHFMDALAHDRRRRRLPAVAVNWGPWTGGGMASTEGERALAQMGVAALRPDEGVLALERVLAMDMPQATVAKVDWTTFRNVYEARARRPLFDRLGTARTIPERATAGGAWIKDAVEAALPHERKGVLARLIAVELARVLGLPDASAVDHEQGFFDLGMDSVMAVELRTRLERGVGAPLPPTIAFDHPTVAKVADFVGREIFAIGAPPPAAEAPARIDAVGSAWDSIEQLTDEEVERLFAEKVDGARN